MNQMRGFDIHKAIEILEREYPKWREPVVTEMARKKRDPFKVLISCILSLRTQDKTTKEAYHRLFSLAQTPLEMSRLSEEEIAQTIYPVGFYRNKARHIKEICRIIQKEYSGDVPDQLEELLELPGVGRKTANLVMTRGFDKPGICVDTHVHRICNRWGYVDTNNPDKTEMVLRKRLPTRYWKRINDLLVAFGQNICRPQSPFCDECPLGNLCPKIRVNRHR
jgi:endonuclease-3